LERLFERMQALGLRANSSMYNALINACAKDADTERAHKWLTYMMENEVPVDVVTYSTVINACARANDLDLAESCHAKMEKNGVKGNAVTYNCMINACARTRKPQQAEDWFGRMLQSDISPAASTFNSLINAWARAGDAVRAEHWLSEMHEHGLEPDAVSYGTVVHACISAGLPPRRAERWLEEMQKRLPNEPPNAYSYNAVISAFADAKILSKAKYWLEEGLRRGVEVRGACLSGVISACLKVGDVEEADWWLCHASALGTSSQASCSAVAKAWQKLGEAEKAAVAAQKWSGWAPEGKRKDRGAAAKPQSRRIA
jgi:pentatricopeptide repeat domain-containing protein 1